MSKPENGKRLRDLTTVQFTMQQPKTKVSNPTIEVEEVAAELEKITEVKLQSLKSDITSSIQYVSH
jgi:hypothetical protein